MILSTESLRGTESTDLGIRVSLDSSAVLVSLLPLWLTPKRNRLKGKVLFSFVLSEILACGQLAPLLLDRGEAETFYRKGTSEQCGLLNGDQKTEKQHERPGQVTFKNLLLCGWKDGVVGKSTWGASLVTWVLFSRTHITTAHRCLSFQCALQSNGRQRQGTLQNLLGQVTWLIQWWREPVSNNVER